MNKQDLVNRTKSFVVKNSGKIVAGTAVIASMAGQASALDAGAIANGSALLTAGIAVSNTEPLGSIIALVAIAFGLTIFIKAVRRFA